MSADSLKISQNADGTFSIEWDKEDPQWSWMNNLTSKEIQGIMEEAIKDYLDDF
jgi:hypothetical protein